jgi:hypothetical protein
MANKTRRPTKAPPPKKPAPKAPSKGRSTPPKGTKQFGTSSTDQENHVPPEMMPDQDIFGNEYIKTMLA